MCLRQRRQKLLDTQAPSIRMRSRDFEVGEVYRPTVWPRACNAAATAWLTDPSRWFRDVDDLQARLDAGRQGPGLVEVYAVVNRSGPLEHGQ